MTLHSTILWVSIIAGMLAASAAVYGRYKILPSFLTGPAVCRLESGGYSVLFRTKRANLLGIPNALLGVTLYLFLGYGLLADWPTLLLVSAATAGLAMSIYLGYSLLKNHLQCRICWLGHISNFIIWLVLCARVRPPVRYVSSHMYFSFILTVVRPKYMGTV